MKLVKYHIVIYVGLFLVSCKTTSYVSSIDRGSKKAEIQSQSDQGSAIYSLQKKGVLKNVENSLKQSLKSDKRDVKSLINLSQIYLAKGAYSQAEEFCRAALKLNLQNIDAKLTLAQIYYRRGFVDMTEIILNSLGDRVNKDSVALNLKGLVALKNDRPAYAMNFFKTALKYNPGDIATRMNLGVLYVFYRQVDAAAIQFERVLKSMPKHVDANLHLAVIKSSRGQYEEAEDLYRSVLEVDPKNALATFNLAVLEEKRKNFDQSMVYLKEYLSTSYAKNQSNKEVFAMIERLKAKKEMAGGSLSEKDLSELNDIASKPKNAPKKENVAIIGEKDETKQDSQTNTQSQSSPDKPKTINKPKVTKIPEKKVPKKKEKYEEDDIESLERALLND